MAKFALAVLVSIAPLTGALLLPATSVAQQGFVDREHQIKAAYLYNFARYAQWPDNMPEYSVGTDRVFVIGVVGDRPLDNSLEEIASKKQVDGKQIVVRRIETAEQYSPCHILYFPAGQQPELLGKLMRVCRNTPTLTVGEDPDFSASGGIVRFFTESNKIKFEINPDAADRVGVKLSAKLMQVGRIVHNR